MRELKSPTNLAWILGRTQTNGPDDYPAVHAVQAGYRLTPLSRYGQSYSPPEGIIDPSADMKTPPVQELQGMSGLAFLTRLAALLEGSQPPSADAPMIAQLAAIGVIPGRPFDPVVLDPVSVKDLDGAVTTALKALQARSRQFGTPVNGWQIPKMNVGAFGTDYDMRAFIALIALGANLPQDALYPTSFVDGEGQPLDGTHQYRLSFDAGMMPPVNTFWSVTMYDPQSFFVENPINRYAISSWMPLQHNRDGSLDLYVQHESPGSEREANWLPAPADAFNVTLRMYWPKNQNPSILDGSWKPPALTRL